MDDRYEYGETRLSARAFNQNVSAARRAADRAPVIVTDRGKPAHVLMSYEEYTRLTAGRRSVLEMFHDPRPEADFDFEPDPPQNSTSTRGTEIDLEG